MTGVEAEEGSDHHPKGPVVIVPDRTWRQLEAWARQGHPHERCGVLVGQAVDGRVSVSEATLARNLETRRPHDRYELDPVDLLRADESARRRGLEVVGIWHTHPDHPARASETDREAAWEGYAYLILSVTEEGVAEARAWALEGERFIEGGIEVWSSE